MANTEIEVKVDATAALHATFKSFAEDYWKEYGVMIESVNFKWNEGFGSANVLNVSIETKSQ